MSRVKQEMSGVRRLQSSVLSCFPTSSPWCNSCGYSLREPGQLRNELECADAITRRCARSFQVEQKVFPSCGQRTLEKATNDTKILKVPKMVFMICLINPGKPGLNFYNMSKKQAAHLSGVTKYVQSVR